MQTKRPHSTPLRVLPSALQARGNYSLNDILWCCVVWCGVMLYPHCAHSSQIMPCHVILSSSPIPIQPLSPPLFPPLLPSLPLYSLLNPHLSLRPYPVPPSLPPFLPLLSLHSRCMALSTAIFVGGASDWLPELVEKARQLKVRRDDA
jgi:hypothetical protein